MQTRAKTLKNDQRCRVGYGLKKNENKGDVELTKNSLKTDNMTVFFV